MDYLSLLAALAIITRFTPAYKGTTLVVFPLAYCAALALAAIVLPLWLLHHERRGSKLIWLPSRTASRFARFVRFAGVSVIGGVLFSIFLGMSVPYLPGRIVQKTAIVRSAAVPERASSCSHTIDVTIVNSGDSYLCISHVLLGSALRDDWLRDGARLRGSTWETVVGTSVVSIDKLESGYAEYDSQPAGRDES